MNRDFAEMLSALSEAGAEFLIVGAHALAAHGLPRATGDLDIWVPLHDLTEEDLVRPGTVFQIGVVPNRIDILTEISGVTFDEAWTKRESFDVEQQRLPFLSRADLAANKRAAGRPKDLADLAALDGDE